MRARSLAALAAIAVAACASRFERDVETARESWSGAPYDEVVARWGVAAAGRVR